jgi:hypothetical protein
MALDEHSLYYCEPIASFINLREILSGQVLNIAENKHMLAYDTIGIPGVLMLITPCQYADRIPPYDYRICAT